MEEPITRAEYEEYQKRIEDEDHRQNKRIEQLEENTKQINALTVSIEKLAQSVESMVKEQEAQGKRLVSLESKDGEMWRINNSLPKSDLLAIFLKQAFVNNKYYDYFCSPKS